jgi:uncharacterized protein
MKTKLFTTYFFCVIFSFSIYGDVSPSIKIQTAKQEILQTYKDVITTKSMQRLKGVGQLGSVAYFGLGSKNFKRFDHCVGVAALISVFSTTQDPALRQQEIVAGLLHDVAHGVFSHGSEHWGYDHDKDGHKYARKDLEKALKKRGYVLNDLLVTESFPILDQSLPHMCADRIDYNIRKGMHLGILTQVQADYILDHLHFNGTRWFFDAPEPALLFARLSTHFTKNLYTTSWNVVFYHYFGEIVRYLLDHKKVPFDLLLHGTDEAVLKVIYAHKSIPFIKKRLEACKNIYDSYQVVDSSEPYDLHVSFKSRGIMPLVQGKDKELLFLKDIKVEDAELQEQIQAYAIEYENVKKHCETGWYLKLKIPSMDSKVKSCK